MSRSVDEVATAASVSPYEPAVAVAPIAPVTPIAPSQRIHYLDNLRALAMLLGVILHAGLAYAEPAQSVWLATDTTSSIAIDIGIWCIHLFRMGLFFLLSGYFAKLVIERKGMKKLLWSRSIRIAVPFVLFYPFLLAAMTVVIVFGLSYVEEPRGLMGMIASAVKGSQEGGAAPEPQPLTTMHLWFLYYLMAFSVISAMLYRLKWLNFDGLFRRPMVLWLCPLVLIPGALQAGAPLPAPESFIPEWWPFAFYGLFYFAGWELFGREGLLDSLRPYALYLVLGCVVLFVPYYMLLPVLDLKMIVAKGETQGSYWVQSIEALLTAYLSVLLTIVSLLFGQRCLASRSPLLSFVADSSYWVYLIHLPIVLVLQTLLIPMEWPCWIKFSAVILGTLGPCLATYLVFVRYTPLGWLLHGKRSFP